MSGVVRVTRVLRAPAAEVFDAWTDASRLRQWLNPGPGVLAEATADPVVGGRFRLVKLTSSGVDEVTGRYLVVDPPRRLVFTWRSPDSTGGAETRVTVDLRPVPAAPDDGAPGDAAAVGRPLPDAVAGEAATEMTITHELIPGAMRRAGAERAWTAIAGRLAGDLAGLAPDPPHRTTTDNSKKR
jgi:uncharacterized protein YndB with AHSA1/START domain